MVGVIFSAILCLTGWLVLCGVCNGLLAKLFHISNEKPAQSQLRALSRLAGAELIFVSMMMLICFVMQHFAVIMVSGIFILFSAIYTAISATKSRQSK